MCTSNNFDPQNPAFLSFITWSLLLFYCRLRKRPTGKFSAVFLVVILCKIIRQAGGSLHYYDGFVFQCYQGVPSELSHVAERVIAGAQNLEAIVVLVPLLYLVTLGKGATLKLFLGLMFPMFTSAFLIISVATSRCEDESARYSERTRHCWFTSFVSGKRANQIRFVDWNTNIVLFELTDDLANTIQLLNILFCAIAIKRSKETRSDLKMILLLLLVSTPRFLLHHTKVGMLIEHLIGDEMVFAVLIEQWYWVAVPLYIACAVEHYKRMESRQESFNLKQSMGIFSVKPDKNADTVVLKMYVRKPSFIVF